METLRAELERAGKEAEEKGKGIQPHWPVARKKEFWGAQDRAKKIRDDIVKAFSEAQGAFQEALGFERRNPEARASLADLYWDQFLRKEEAEDRSGMLLYENLVRQYNDGQFDDRLQGNGTLTLRTWKYPCDCLLPVKDERWRVRIHSDRMVPIPFGSREFREVEKRFIPKIEIGPEGATPGHGPDCRREPVPGAEIRILRYEEEERRLVAKGPVWQGRGPVERLSLPMGSYLAEVRLPDHVEVRVPVRIGRLADVEQDVTLYTTEEVGEDAVVVPAGKFIEGGEKAGGARKTVRDIPYDYFVKVHPVTCGEYVEYLNDLSKTDPEQAWKRSPRSEPEGGQIWPRDDKGRFKIPTASWLSQAPEAQKKTARRLTNAVADWEEDWPIFSVSWYDAHAFCEWKSCREGRVLTLLTDEEWEKAARGVDGRVFPFGDHFDSTWGNIQGSHAEGLKPSRVDAFPIDESPYGVRGMGGNSRDWCLSDPGEKFREWRALRGGGWCNAPIIARAGGRLGDAPTIVLWLNGLRLVSRSRTYSD
jgi:formylglycine-generating enzyme required for sulfatase activity